MRKRASHGFSFALNYTLSKSLDHSSTPERQESDGFFTGGYTGFTINAWQPNLEYSYSDFDMRHQFNSYLTWDLPVGRGRRFGSDMHSVVNAIVGGWQLSSILRFNSGVPANIVNGRTWPTNWNLQGNATCAPKGANLLGLDVGPCPATQNSHSAHHGSSGEATPNLFANPDEAIQHFRFTEPGGRGQRNVLRGDGYGTVGSWASPRPSRCHIQTSITCCSGGTFSTCSTTPASTYLTTGILTSNSRLTSATTPKC